MNSILKLDAEPDLALKGILHSVFHRPASNGGIAIAFTSANPGEGVSYVSKRIASQIGDARSESVMHLTSAQLGRELWPGASGRSDGLVIDSQIVPTNTWDDWRSKLTKLRSRYRYSIIDCPSLSTGSDVLGLAPHVDGIVVVVAANKTRKAQVMNVEREIQMVHGKVFGFVLNKREYIVPRWIHKLL
jgi:hypothetical protein